MNRNKFGRAHSTRDYVYSDEEAENSQDLDDDDYEYAYRIRNYAHRGATRQKQRNPYAYSMTLDPAWQKFLFDFYRQHGYYPTYEQLHQMWAEQQQSLVLGQAAIRPPSDSGSNNKKLNAPAGGLPRKLPAEQRAKPMADMSRTELYVASQQNLLFDIEKTSQLSVTISKPDLANDAPALESDRSLEVLSSNVSAATDAFNIQAPFKHSIPHAVARFSAGGHIVTVCPKIQNGKSGQLRPLISHTVEIRPFRHLVKSGRDPNLDAHFQKLDSFPGPLNADATDKNAVIEFCRRKREECRTDMSIMDKDSASLLWNTLSVLIRQNGNVTGPDLSRLLMDGCSSYDNDHVTESESRPVLIGPYYESIRDAKISVAEQNASRDAVAAALTHASTQTVDTVERHFRELLYFGAKKEALEWAIRHKLWGHALFLAMKIDQRTHNNVMIRFANSLPLSDPLQTLYQMMSGVSPSAVTRLSDEKWSDWRPHLAMILSNLSQFNGQPSDERALRRELNSVMTLGNTLMDDGRTFAAQFCYLCCHALCGWAVFDLCPLTGRRFVTLLGAHSESNEDSFLNVDYYQMTEIYEYAIGLAQYTSNKESVFLPSLQMYKLKYAMLLLEAGNAETAYKYLTVLGTSVLNNADRCSPVMKHLIIDLGSRLHAFDLTAHSPDYSNSPADNCDYYMPQWLIDLKNLTVGSSKICGQSQNAPESAILAPDSSISQLYQPSSNHQSVLPPTTNQKRRSFFIGAPNRQDSSPPESRPESAAQPYPATQKLDPATRRPDPAAQKLDPVPSWKTVPEQYAEPYRNTVPELHRKTVPEPFNFSTVPEPYAPGSRNSLDYAVGGAASATNYQSPFTVVPPNAAVPDPRPSNRQSRASSLDAPQHFVVSDGVGVDHDPATAMPREFSPGDAAEAYQNEYENINYAAYGPNSDGQNREISPPNYQQARKSSSNNTYAGSVGVFSPSNDSVFAPSPLSARSAPPNFAPKSGPGQSEKQEQQQSKLDASKRNSSWLAVKLGGVVKKFLPKDSNEMILPDDKQKAIHWDEKAGRWVNTDGDSSEMAPPPPPPSASMSLPAVSTSNVQTNQLQSDHQQQINSAYAAGHQNQANFSNAQPTPTPKSAGRFGAHGKRYATVNSFGVIQNDVGQPLTPSPLFGFAGAASAPTNQNRAYFVPQPISDDGAAPPVDYLTNAEAVAASTPVAAAPSIDYATSAAYAY